MATFITWHWCTLCCQVHKHAEALQCKFPSPFPAGPVRFLSLILLNALHLQRLCDLQQHWLEHWIQHWNQCWCFFSSFQLCLLRYLKLDPILPSSHTCVALSFQLFPSIHYSHNISTALLFLLYISLLFTLMGPVGLYWQRSCMCAVPMLMVCSLIQQLCSIWG